MITNPNQFLEQEREDPEKLSIQSRTKNFEEIYGHYSEDKAKSQAARCLDCGNPYCKWQCPVANHIPEWLKLVKSGNIIQAAELSNQTNSLPEICGRVCPQDRLCEGACTLNEDFGAVSIGAIEKFITDEAYSRGWRPNTQYKQKFSKEKVAIIGAGPAGLACADMLLRNGIKAIIYDKYPEIGGLLTYGIPSFKLDKAIVRRRRSILEEMGAEFKLNTEIGLDISFDKILDEYDAVFLALGTYKALDGNLPGKDLNNVYQALPYLISNVRKQLGQSTNFIDMQGKKLVVLGGGDTAMDCTRTAIRQQAESVTCIYRRAEKEMPGSKKEVENAKEEGVKFLWNLQPVSIKKNNSKLIIQNFKTKTENSKLILSDEIEEIEADAIILAFGFEANPPQWLIDKGIRLDSKNRILLTKDLPYQTNLDKIFAGGDMVRGADLVVRAIFDGREAAKSIIKTIKKTQ